MRNMVMKTAVVKGGGWKRLWFAYAGATLAIFACTCAETQLPSTSTATVTQNPCRDAKAWRYGLGILQPKIVVEIEPHYTRNTCDGTTQVIGTQIVMSRPDESSAAALSQMLRCGASRVWIGKDNPSMPSRTPFWLPDGWLDVGVKPDGVNFLVTLSAESVPKNIQLFRRTTDFLRARRPAGIQ